MTDEIDLGRERRRRKVDNAGDSRLWTVRDALAETLQEIDAGKMNPDKVVMILWESHPKDPERVAKMWRCAGVGAEDIVVMTQFCSYDVLKHMDGDG